MESATSMNRILVALSAFLLLTAAAGFGVPWLHAIEVWPFHSTECASPSECAWAQAQRAFGFALASLKWWSLVVAILLLGVAAATRGAVDRNRWMLVTAVTAGWLVLLVARTMEPLRIPRGASGGSVSMDGPFTSFLALLGQAAIVIPGILLALRTAKLRDR